jgi:hypothetical protein
MPPMLIRYFKAWFAPFMNALMDGMFPWLDGHSSTMWGRILVAQGNQKYNNL